MKDIFNKKQRRKYLIGFLIIAAVLLSFAFFMVPNVNNSPFGGKDQTFTTDPNSAADSGTQSYSGSGIKNNVTEYGEGYFQNNELELWNGDEASITVPEDWQGNELEVNFTDIYEREKLWINDTFDTGYDSNSWSTEVVNSDNAGPINFGWYDDTVGNNDSIYMEFSNSAPTWANVESYWNNTFYLDREKIPYDAWTINFDYKLVYDDSNWIEVTGGSAVTAIVSVGGIENTFKVRNLNDHNNNTWFSDTIDPFEPEIYDFEPPGQVSLKIGIDYGQIEITGASGNLTTYIENVTFNIPNIPKPEQIDLDINDESNGESYNITNLNNEFGLGQVNILDNWDGASPYNTHYFNFTTNSTANVEIYSDFFVYATSSKTTITEQGAKGSIFTVENNTRVQWDMYFDVSIPGTYDTGYYFNISKPKNWNVTHVYNSYGNDKIDNVTATSGPGNTTLQIPSDIIIGGRWHIVAESPNFILNSSIWNATNGEWQKENNFYPLETLKVNSTIYEDKYNLIPNIELTNATQEVCYPNGTVWNTLTEEKPINSDYTVNFTEFSIPQTAPPGQYSILIKYQSNDISQVGYLVKTFNVIHRTDLKRADDQAKVLTPVFSGDKVNIKVNYTDLDFSEGVYQGNVNYSIFDESSSKVDSGEMSYSAGGEYYSEIDTQGWSYGTYNISVSASKEYYEPKYQPNLIQIEVTQTTSISSPDESGINIPYGNNATIDITYETTEETGIPNAIIECEWPEEYYFVNETGSDGDYHILLNTSTQPIGSQVIRINATKSGYETQNINIPLNIRTIFTKIEYTQPDPKEFNKNITFTVNYIDKDNNKNISDATLRISNSSDSAYWSLTDGDFYYFENPDGSYTITFNSSYYEAPGSYSIYVTANKTFYSTSSTLVNVFVEKISTVLYSPQEGGLDVPYGNNVTLDIYFNTTDGTGLSEATIDCDWTEGYYYVMKMATDGHYQILVNSSGKTIGSHVIKVNATKPNYETHKINIPLNVRKIYTKVEYTQPAPVEYYDNVTFTVNYFDTDNDKNISDATLRISNSSDSDYWSLTDGDFYYFENPDGSYNVSFDTTYLGNIGTYSIYITANKTHYASSATVVSFFIEEIETILSSDQEGGLDIPYGNNVTLDIYFNTTDGTGLSEATIDCDWEEGYYDVVKMTTEGYYQILVNTSGAKKGSYIIEVNATKTNYEYQKINIPLNIRMVYTDINYEQPSPVELYENITFTINYIDIDNHLNISEATLSISNSSDSEPWDLNDFYYFENGDGSYTITFNSSYYKSTGTYSIYVKASKGQYSPSATLVNVFIEDIGTYLENITLNGVKTTDIELPIGSNIDVSVNYYEHLWDTNILNASLVLEGEEISESLTQQDGLYNYLLNTTELGIGVRFLTLSAQKPNYETSSIRLRVEVTRIEINITTISAEKFFTIKAGQSFTLQVKLKNEDFGGLITNANVSYSYQYGQGRLDGPDADGYFTKVFDNLAQGEQYTFSLFVSAGDNYQSEPFEISVNVEVPESSGGGQNLLLFQILTFVGIGAAVAITGYLIAYQKVLKYPKPIRKIHKYKKVVKKGKDKEMDIQSRKDAIKSRYKDEYEERMPGKPKKDIIDDKDITDRKGIRDKGNKDNSKNGKVKK